MKKYRIRKGSIADVTVKAVRVLDQEPWALIIYTAVCAALMIGGALTYNTVVPAYQ